MDTTIFLFLVQDGLTNGAIYALLGLALVLVFSVTRVILIPQGEFVAYGALTLAMLDTGRVPGTASLLLVFGAGAFLIETWSYWREWRTRASMLRRLVRSAAFYLGLPIVIWGLVNL